MTILDKILQAKTVEVESRKALYPVKLLEQSLYYEGKTVSLKKYLQREDLVGVIAEIKRRSPSKGAIHPSVDVEMISMGYMQGGASALSILTDKEFFGGSSDDLSKAREFNFCPILRKDFIIDEYQVIEAKSIGADVLLLIAAALDTARMEQLSSLARSLGLEVLIEVHSEEELQKLPDGAADAIGVNNRDLKTFTVRRELSLELSDKIPHEVVKVSESGIEEPGHLLELRAAGYRGFLIGERFMREARPHDACRKFIEEVQRTAMK